MTEDRYNEILANLNKMQTNTEKLQYLDREIEANDSDCNGYNDSLVELRNKITKKCKP